MALHIAYPTDSPQHSVLAQHKPTPTTTLLDVLSITDNVDLARLVQVLAKLETAQILCATVKSLNIEEERVAGADDKCILRMDATKARLAPALSDFHSASRDFTMFLANVHFDSGDIAAVYKLEDASSHLRLSYTGEMDKATSR